MHIQLLLLLAAAHVQIGKGDEENNCVYQNLYGCKDYNYSRVETFAKLPAGVIKFTKESDDLLARETRDTTPAFNAAYDFVVVGAGSAGCTIAARLTELDDVTVLLIEAGGEEKLIYDVPSLVQFLQLSPVVNWKYQTEPSTTYCLGMDGRRCNWPRGKVMGGSSVLNYMAANRGHPLDYDGWAEMGNTGWSYNETLKYFLKLEKIEIPELKGDKRLHNTEGPLSISYPPFRTPLAGAFLKAAAEKGYPVVDLNGEKRIGYSYTPYTAKNGERMSTNRAYLYPNRKRRNLKVSKRSRVNKVLIHPRSKRAYGVEFTKSLRLKRRRTIRVKARKEIILCAGAIDSPKLLMLSGVGPADHLKDMKIEVLQDAPVGKNLMDHVMYPALVFLVDQPVAIRASTVLNPFQPYIVDYLTRREGPYVTPGTNEAIGFLDTDKPRDLDAYPNTELYFLAGSLVSDLLVRLAFGISDEHWDATFANFTGMYTWSVFPILLHPRSRGEVLLANRDPKSKPRMFANYFDDPEDVRVMIKGIREAIEISRTKAMQRFESRVSRAPIRGCEKYGYDSDDYWECAARTFGTTLYHQSGTCKMAPEDDPSGVVNPRLQVKGVKGLRVADASIMPTIITGHINIPTIMIAEKLADMVKEDWGYTGIK